MATDIEHGISNSIKTTKETEAKKWFSKIIQREQYVGELYSINYDTANVIIHNFHRQKVGGISSLSFLIATRLTPDNKVIDYKKEDSSVILMRVMDSIPLPQDADAERIRVETAEKVSGEDSNHWDMTAMDSRTKNIFDYAGLQCRIIGTFYLDDDPNNSEAPLVPRFGSDISNYYPNRGLKVYKPNADALSEIVNYCDPSNLSDQMERFHSVKKVKLGNVRYASTNRRFQQVDDVPVYIYPSDLLSQKSALFGMTRTGKSNTTKIIAKSVYELRQTTDSREQPLRVGQLIFDPNGEYANENVQDNNNALKNVYQLIENADKSKEVATYGITTHPNDVDRNIMKLNFYLDENLQIGKEIIDRILLSEQQSTYIKNFCQVILEKPDENDYSAIKRYNRTVLAYRAVLAKAGFSVPRGIRHSTKGLFNKDLLDAMRNSTSSNAPDYNMAATIFNDENPSLDRLAIAFENLDKFIRDNASGYQAFENQYINRPKGSGEPWADSNFKNIIGIFQYPNGTRRISHAQELHSPNTRTDYAQDIYDQLKAGKLVIVDQSTGDPELNQSSAKRIMTKIFQENQKLFIQGETDIPEILVYIEEAHNILPAGNNLDLKDIWVRAAKEGAKYKIGMVYATQEVSSIQRNILRNTSNWFIAHLNNTDETKELCKYYDFKDFEPSIRRAQDKGFLRVKTLSNPFVIPVQVDKFVINYGL